jgi:hypothetical protein
MTSVSQPSPLLAVRQQALALAGSGDLAGARALLEHGVAAGQANLGEDDPEVLATARQLAAVHRQADDPSAARRVLEEAFAAGQWRLGETDPLMLEISYDIGTVAEELGNRHEARKAFARVAENGPAVLGADHWAVTQARAYLGDDPAATPIEPAPVEPARDDVVRVDPTRSDTVRMQLPQSAVQRAPLTPAPERRAAPAHQQQGLAHQQGATYQQTPTHQQVPAYQQSPVHQQVPAYQQRPGQVYQHSPAAGEQAVPPVGPSSPVSHATVDAPYGKKGPALFAAIAAVLAAVIAVAALVFVLANRDSGSGDKGGKDVPTLAGEAPGDVVLRDHGGFVQLSWTDPAAGKTSFMVTGGRPGEVLRPLGQVGPGQTTYTLQGLNAKLDYCFAVVAVYSTDTFATSPPACTSRVSSPAPSASR